MAPKMNTEAFKDKQKSIQQAYQLAKVRYLECAVDTEKALKELARVPISLHCWQGDDVGGFENFGGTLGGGLVATGNYPGKARTPDELRADLEKAYSLIPGRHRLNLHALYIVAFVWIALNAALLARLIWIDWIRRAK